eukprot:TRINITY_DN1369_c0_g2_i1.p1 TRINITY_DN1369_c0_g2~~TRINITY_DN1369_c0_g2_i1.p1  ORF type:complete len:167 (+),score=53.71 TRINITY_DN1369_c0_g2_i1:299-799(+)
MIQESDSPFHIFLTSLGGETVDSNASFFKSELTALSLKNGGDELKAEVINCVEELLDRYVGDGEDKPHPHSPSHLRSPTDGNLLLEHQLMGDGFLAESELDVDGDANDNPSMAKTSSLPGGPLEDSEKGKEEEQDTSMVERRVASRSCFLFPLKLDVEDIIREFEK